jgi:hypothetical protein
MAELYRGPTTDFLEQATQNRPLGIAETLRQAFLADMGYEPPTTDSEQRSWRNSLRALANALSAGRASPTTGSSWSTSCR